VSPDAFTSVPLAHVRFVTEAWPRQYADPERIEDFATLYREEGVAALPPPELVPDRQGSFLIGDGVHRIEAARQVGFATIPAHLLDVPADRDPVEFTYLHALARSAISSKPLTRAEKQAAIRRLIVGNPDASDREIGRLLGVDHKTVGRIRRGASPARPRPDGWVPGPSPATVAKRLFEAFEKAYEARGLGIADFFVGDRTGERLAGVLTDVYGERAAAKAAEFRRWLDLAVGEFEKRSG
jgi:ParB-like nuclease domain